MIKLIIAGGRDFSSGPVFSSIVKQWLAINSRPDQIVTGCCPTGVDRFGELLAKSMDIDIAYFKPNWSRQGISAGPKRNKAMAEYATHCLCIWDGKSRGTKSMIDEAKKAKINLMVFNYEGKLINV